MHFPSCKLLRPWDRVLLLAVLATVHTSEASVTWYINKHLPGSCNAVCSQIGGTCSQDALDDLGLTNSNMKPEVLKQAYEGASGESISCEDWVIQQDKLGSPYLPSNWLTGGVSHVNITCRGYNSAGACGEEPELANHRRLCPCTEVTTTPATTIEAYCTRPSAEGYDLTACASTIARAGWNTSCGTCSAGYTGSVTHRVCSSTGESWSVSGCEASSCVTKVTMEVGLPPPSNLSQLAYHQVDCIGMALQQWSVVDDSISWHIAYRCCFVEIRSCEVRETPSTDDGDGKTFGLSPHDISCDYEAGEVLQKFEFLPSGDKLKVNFTCCSLRNLHDETVSKETTPQPAQGGVVAALSVHDVACGHSQLMSRWQFVGNKSDDVNAIDYRCLNLRVVECRFTAKTNIHTVFYGDTDVTSAVRGDLQDVSAEKFLRLFVYPSAYLSVSAFTTAFENVGFWANCGDYARSTELTEKWQSVCLSNMSDFDDAHLQGQSTGWRLATQGTVDIGLNAAGLGDDRYCVFRTRPEACVERLLNGDGRTYRGCQVRTRGGKLCQMWSSQSPHEHGFTTAAYPSSGLGTHNYCRNPGGERQTLWCFTTDPSTIWDYCDLLQAPIPCSQYTTDGVLRFIIVSSEKEHCTPSEGGQVTFNGSECSDFSALGFKHIQWSSMQSIDMTDVSVASSCEKTCDGSYHDETFCGQCGIAPIRNGGDQLPRTCQACPWLYDTTRVDDTVMCADGTYRIDWDCVASGHGQRMRCPPNLPNLCADTGCGSLGADYCCDENCSAWGGIMECAEANLMYASTACAHEEKDIRRGVHPMLCWMQCIRDPTCVAFSVTNPVGLSERLGKNCVVSHTCEEVDYNASWDRYEKRTEAHCVRIVTGSASEDAGYLEVYVDAGSGLFQAVASSYFQAGQIVLNMCEKHEFVIVSVRNPTNDRWAGSISWSDTQGYHLHPMTCLDCTAGFDGDRIVVDGDTDLVYQAPVFAGYALDYAPTVCVGGQLCSLKACANISGYYYTQGIDNSLHHVTQSGCRVEVNNQDFGFYIWLYDLIRVEDKWPLEWSLEGNITLLDTGLWQIDGPQATFVQLAYNYVGAGWCADSMDEEASLCATQEPLGSGARGNLAASNPSTCSSFNATGYSTLDLPQLIAICDAESNCVGITFGSASASGDFAGASRLHSDINHAVSQTGVTCWLKPGIEAIVRTTTIEGVLAGANSLKLADVSGLAVGMLLSISDSLNKETKMILSINPGDSRRLSSRRLTASGTVILDGQLQHTYAHGASIEAVTQVGVPTSSSNTTTSTNTTQRASTTIAAVVNISTTTVNASTTVSRTATAVNITKDARNVSATTSRKTFAVNISNTAMNISSITLRATAAENFSKPTAANISSSTSRTATTTNITKYARNVSATTSRKTTAVNISNTAMNISSITLRATASVNFSKPTATNISSSTSRTATTTNFSTTNLSTSIGKDRPSSTLHTTTSLIPTSSAQATSSFQPTISLTVATQTNSMEPEPQYDTTHLSLATQTSSVSTSSIQASSSSSVSTSSIQTSSVSTSSIQTSSSSTFATQTTSSSQPSSSPTQTPSSSTITSQTSSQYASQESSSSHTVRSLHLNSNTTSNENNTTFTNSMAGMPATATIFTSTTWTSMPNTTMAPPSPSTLGLDSSSTSSNTTRTISTLVSTVTALTATVSASASASTSAQTSLSTPFTQGLTTLASVLPPTSTSKTTPTLTATTTPKVTSTSTSRSTSTTTQSQRPRELRTSTSKITSTSTMRTVTTTSTATSASTTASTSKSASTSISRPPAIRLGSSTTTTTVGVVEMVEALIDNVFEQMREKLVRNSSSPESPMGSQSESMESEPVEIVVNSSAGVMKVTARVLSIDMMDASADFAPSLSPSAESAESEPKQERRRSFKFKASTPTASDTNSTSRGVEIEIPFEVVEQMGSVVLIATTFTTESKKSLPAPPTGSYEDMFNVVGLTMKGLSGTTMTKFSKTVKIDLGPGRGICHYLNEHAYPMEWTREGVIHTRVRGSVVCEVDHFSFFGGLAEAVANVGECSNADVLSEEGIKRILSKPAWMGGPAGILIVFAFIFQYIILFWACKKDSLQRVLRNFHEDMWFTTMERPEARLSLKQAILYTLVGDEFVDGSLAALAAMHFNTRAAISFHAWLIPPDVKLILKYHTATSFEVPETFDGVPVVGDLQRNCQEYYDSYFVDATFGQKVLIMFMAVHPWSFMLQSSIRLSHVMRTSLFVMGQLNSMFVACFFFQSSGGALADGAPDTCASSDLPFLIVRVIMVGIVSNVISLFAPIVVYKCHHRRFHTCKEGWTAAGKRRRKLWIHGVDACLTVFALIWSNFCFVFITAFFANVDVSMQYEVLGAQGVAWFWGWLFFPFVLSSFYVWVCEKHAERDVNLVHNNRLRGSNNIKNKRPGNLKLQTSESNLDLTMAIAQGTLDACISKAGKDQCRERRLSAKSTNSNDSNSFVPSNTVVTTSTSNSIAGEYEWSGKSTCEEFEGVCKSHATVSASLERIRVGTKLPSSPVRRLTQWV